MSNELPVVIPCLTDELVGIIHDPEHDAKTAMVIIVAGGPQFRVGANRQFVILSRRIAEKGLPILRFDHRGTGDSDGECRGFIDMADDIRSAVDSLCNTFPQIENILLWGECESASAAAFYAHTDPRVKGIFMVNPWIRTESGQAQTYLKHYYWNRIRDPKFWKKLTSGQFSYVQSVKSWFELKKVALADSPSGKKSTKGNSAEAELSSLPLPERVTKSLQLFSGNIYILTSGFDYIAQEFKDYINNSPLWKNSDLNERIDFSDMPDADHTFSRQEWREQLFVETEEWALSDKHHR